MTVQGKRSLFALTQLGSSELHQIVLSSRIPFQSIFSSGKEILCFLECTSFRTFTKSSLVAFKTKKTSEDFKLGAILSLHPKQVQVAEIVLRSDITFDALEVKTYNIQQGDYLQVYYLNMVSPESIAADGCISAATDGPDTVEINNYDDNNFHSRDMPAVYNIHENYYHSESMSLPKVIYNRNKTSTYSKQNRRNTTMACKGALLCVEDEKEDVDRRKTFENRYLWEYIP